MSTGDVVIDANAIIALRDARDGLHLRATATLRALIGRPKLVHPLTLSEVLVHPARRGGREEVARQRVALERAGFVVISGTSLPEPEDIAAVRASGLTMPDAVVLASAAAVDASLVTFDKSLAAAAREVAVTVVDEG